MSTLCVLCVPCAQGVFAEPFTPAQGSPDNPGEAQDIEIATGNLGGFSAEAPARGTLEGVSQSATPVHVTILLSGDFSDTSEFATISIGNWSCPTRFLELNGRDCAAAPVELAFDIDPSTWNALVARSTSFTMPVTFVGGPNVTADACVNAVSELKVRYLELSPRRVPVIGPTGPQGDRGPVGSNGPSGPQGPVGPIGPVGPVGAKGADGEPGTPGAVGAVGASGDVGPVGPQGVQGEPASTAWAWLAGMSMAVSVVSLAIAFSKRK